MINNKKITNIILTRKVLKYFNFKPLKKVYLSLFKIKRGLKYFNLFIYK